MERIMSYHICPNCRYVITALEATQARYDFDCPRCQSIKISKFQIVRHVILDNEVET